MTIVEALRAPEEEIRVGVYICQCGLNIAAAIDCEAVAEWAEDLEGVTVSRSYSYMCSDPGQQLVKQDIKELSLNRVVVASCSPRLHEPTFRQMCAEAGLNPYLFEMANIREQCSWVHDNREEATRKARELVAAAVSRVALHVPLHPRRVAITPAALVMGGGIAGIQAALDIADAGYQVYLVERESTIGGKMAQLDKTFPTLDCAT